LHKRLIVRVDNGAEIIEVREVLFQLHMQELHAKDAVSVFILAREDYPWVGIMAFGFFILFGYFFVCLPFIIYYWFEFEAYQITAK
jgi:hypothetical protein